MPKTLFFKQQTYEKLLSQGEQALTDAELLAVLLPIKTQGKQPLALAKGLLREYGNLKKLLRTSPQLITKKTGLGYIDYATLKAAVELGRRYINQAPLIGTAFNNSRKTQKFLAQRLREYNNEVFACLFMDNHFRLICFEELFHGTINQANVYPREIVKRGLLHNAAKIILAHNHPSGLPSPSLADKDLTQWIKQALELIDIAVVDHIIVGDPENFSFADAGIL